MSREPGYKVKRLAKLLQKNFPDRNGLPVIWKPEAIYCAKGAWRKKSMDVWSWQAFAEYENGGTAYHAGSYETVTALIKATTLEMCRDGEVWAAKEQSE